MAASEAKVFLSLYRQLLRESGKFSSYNFRNYFVRRVRDDFRSELASGKPVVREEFLVSARDMLALVQRQAAVGNMYAAPKMVLEKAGQATPK
ncbi:LYR motif-containing protein 4B-like [Sycon ciliatum]|uniref:LYR motif-containing protein 4B-like n=1 Tax=Sycon ciliatum TaxID=27933 RepID=UPI0031F71F2A